VNKAPATKLLLVEDSPGDARLIREMLEEPGSQNIELTHVQRMSDAEAHLAGCTVDIILLDLGLPDAQGLEAVYRCRAAAPRVPLVLLTIVDDESVAAQALHEGVQDYLVKGQIDARTLRRALRYAMDRNISETALRGSDLRFSQLADTIHDVFFTIDLPSARMSYVSPAYERIWGRSCQSLYAEPGSWADSIHPDDREFAVAKCIRPEAGFDCPLRIIRPDGDQRWVRIRGFPILDETGKSCRTAGVASDITESRRAADALRESERRFSDLLANVSLVSLMLDRDARITYCNDYLLELTGWQRHEVLGRDWFELFLPSPHHGLKQLFVALLANAQEARHHENEILTRTGVRRLIHWNNSILRSAAGEVVGMAGIGEDITEQRHAQRKISNLNRVHAVLSGITAHLIRINNREELYREACRVAVDDGRFLMAWIGIVDPVLGTLNAVTSAGDVGDFFQSPQPAVTEFQPGCRALTERAMREKKPMVSQDIRTDPQTMGCKAPAGKGINSFAVVPLVVSGEAIGVFALYATEDAGFFDGEEMKLLVQLADNISIWLEHIDKSAKLEYLAYYDALTGLANRALFLDRVEQKLIAGRDEKRKVAVFALDIERFKTVNEALGRKAGDDLLRQIGERLRKAGHLDTHFAGVTGDHFAVLRDGSRVARVAADHFAIVATEAQNEEQFAELTQFNLKQCFGPPFRIGKSEVRISAKIGIAVFPTDGADAETLLSNATAAVRKAKASGERYAFYSQELNRRSTARLTLETRLRQALEAEEFVLHYQPKIELASRRIVGVEALVRWQSRDLGLVPPLQFIPLMEETGMILELGTWALRTAVTDQLRWLEMGLPVGRMAVNVSALQFRKKDFLNTIRDAVRHGVNPAGLDLEITESLIMDDIEDNIQKLSDLRALGVSIAIDDFGTGYSSLAYLAKLPVETLKIDKSFVMTMLRDADTMTLVQTIISLAHSLRLKVVAEGVESEEQAAILRRMQCDEMQGYLFSKPLAPDALVTLLTAYLSQSHPGADAHSSRGGSRVH
jgi:diguanylate cyclase (GGDEF)-like protein/PAS domain S-box-containing protein